MRRIVLLCLLLCALFLRVYRQADLLGFYFDQGRDAKVIWDLWHNHKFFLIGPTTGIEGIFLGPFYYYYIAPFYALGGGNPVWPAFWVALTNILALALLYHIASKYYSPTTGLIAVFFITFSLDFVQAQRWLANPTPLPLFALLAFYALLQTIHGSTKHWWLLGLMLGLSLQFEAASAVFFLPATMLILVINRKSLSKIHTSLFMLLTFGLTLLPQIIFNFKHENILVTAFLKFLVADRSFQSSIFAGVHDRLLFYFTSFSHKFVLADSWATVLALLVGLLALMALPHLRAKPTRAALIWWLTPLTILLFYHGNNGYVWEYYFTGVYPVFMLLISAVLVYTAKSQLAKLVVLAIMVLFLQQNLPHIYSYLTAGTNGPIHVTLGPEVAAVDWVYSNATAPFNVDEYVPPVIPHSYDYLFLWRGTTKFHALPAADLKPDLYTIYEVDPPHPERLSAWLARQAGIATVHSQTQYGGITVQHRLRLP